MCSGAICFFCRWLQLLHELQGLSLKVQVPQLLLLKLQLQKVFNIAVFMFVSKAADTIMLLLLKQKVVPWLLLTFPKMLLLLLLGINDLVSVLPEC